MTPVELAVTHHQVPVRNGNIHVAEAGHEFDKCVVFIHGFPESWWSWRHQVEAFVAAGYHVLAVDLRGYGDSTREGPFDLRTLAADVAEVIRVRARGRAAVVGHDWGGATAWTLAAHHPERVARVAVLNCPLPRVLQEKLVRRPSFAQLKRSWYIFFFQIPGIPELLLSRHQGRAIADIIRKASRHHANTSDAELAPFCEGASTAAGVRGMLGAYRAALPAAFKLDVLPPITMPAMLMWGLEDHALSFDELAPETERAIPGLRVEALAGCGHFPQSERPELVNRTLIEFIG